MKKLLASKIFFVFFLFAKSALASFEPGRLPPAYMATGCSGIASELSSFFHNNPALLAFSTRTELSLQYRNYYNISQLNEFGLSFQMRLKSLPLGAFISQFGDQNYKEQQFSLHMAYLFYKKVSFGLAIQNYFLQIKNYGNYHALGLTLGVKLKVLSWLNIATVLGNLNEPKISSKKGDIPVYFVNGISLHPMQKVQITFDLFKDERFDFDYRAGLRYNLNSMLTLLFGFRQQVHTFSTGIIFNRKFVSFCYALEYHPQLGVSNAISVGYFF